MRNRKYINDELHDFTWSKVLSKITSKKRPHEGLKSTAFAIKIRISKIHAFKITYYRSNFLRCQSNVITEHLSILLSTFFVQIFNSVVKIVVLLVPTFQIIRLFFLRNCDYLKIVWLTRLSMLSLIPYFAKNKFIQLIKSL